jgi:glycosyltransferase involved in cell wall biosynthesis
MDRAAEPLLEQTTASSTAVSNGNTTRPIRVLSLMEAKSVTGPAKNMLEFGARSHADPASRVSLSFATFQREPGLSNAFIDWAREAGLQVNVIEERFPFDPRIVSKLRALMKTAKPDIIQSHNFKGHFLVRFAALHRSCRWVAFHHGYTYSDFKNQIYNQLDRWSLPRAHRVVTVCRPFAEHLAKIGVAPERISVQHNMVNSFVAASEAEVRRLREIHHIPPDALVVLSVGRLSREKGFRDLIEAVGLLRSEILSREVRFVIVGEGPERAEITARANNLGVADFVVLAGQQQQMTGYYSMADLVAMPSLTEGSPNVLLEAMAAGKAIVATRVGGIPEIAQTNENALLVGSSNPRELAAAVWRLITDIDLRKRLAAAAPGAAKQFDPEHYCRSLSAIYARVLSED